MTAKTFILFFILSAVLPMQGAGCADRTAEVDADGVMRWIDDGSEVALFGVNYHLPFAFDYTSMERAGHDFERTMLDDVAHFRRLGLTLARLHCFDRQISTREGDIIENRHTELLDRLVATLASNGIYTAITPIAWWGTGSKRGENGFSGAYTMQEMTSGRKAREAQKRFLKAFAGRVNRFTGRRYADDPAVVCFELINEPLYKDGQKDAEVTAYINELADALRSSGTVKPIFYNSWKGRNSAAGAARIDGVSGCSYPTGLACGHALRGGQLAKVEASSLKPDGSISRKAKMIYEFDAADTPGAYMYPAFARLFRSEGVQIAAQFQYDALPLAGANENWMTHHLNLVYTPAKALSLAIAAEAFRMLPRGCGFARSRREMSFPPFFTDAARNLSQMVTETDYLYTSDPVLPPPAPEKLRRIWGVGRSSVAASTGSGIYFLDKIADGRWRLQLYPSVFNVRDAYSGGKSRKVALLDDTPELTLALPDLGESFRAEAVDGGVAAGTAECGSIRLKAGDYILVNPSLAGKGGGIGSHLPPYVATRPDVSPTGIDASGMPFQWQRGRSMAMAFSAVGVTNFILTAETPRGAITRSFPVRQSRDVNDWEFFLPVEASRPYIRRSPGVDKYSARDPMGMEAVGFSAGPGAFSDGNGYAGIRLDCDLAAFRALFGNPGRGRTVLCRARATDRHTKRIEVVFSQEDGGAWGFNLPVTDQWRTFRIPVDEMKPFWETRRGDGTEADMSRVQAVSVGYGKWLYKDSIDKPHGFEISSIKVEF